MYFTFNHTNLNVANLEKSLAFYREALGLLPVRTHTAQDGSFTLTFLSDGESSYQLELTCLKAHPQPYELGENETHLCFTASDYEAAHEKHRQMGCICYENTKMGLYFIEDPDGYWIEIVRPKH